MEDFGAQPQLDDIIFDFGVSAPLAYGQINHLTNPSLDLLHSRVVEHQEQFYPLWDPQNILQPNQIWNHSEGTVTEQSNTALSIQPDVLPPTAQQLSFPWYGTVNPTMDGQFTMPSSLAYHLSETEDLISNGQFMPPTGQHSSPFSWPVSAAPGAPSPFCTPVMAGVSESVPSYQSDNADNARHRPSDASTMLHTCIVCAKKSKTTRELLDHAKREEHATIRCNVQPCPFTTCIRGQAYREHLRRAHPNRYSCVGCEEAFESQYNLDWHLSNSGHVSLICDQPDCEQAFSRMDTYLRHQMTHQEDVPRYPCKYCKKYRGSNGFKRKDHLTQHLRGYHHIGEENIRPVQVFLGGISCPYVECSDYRTEANWERVFKTRPEYITHLRAAHNASDFPCPQPCCERVGAKGYFRKADLRSHLKKIHDITDATIVDPPKERH